MEERLEGWTTVIVGAWNPRIFTPGWVAGRLTDASQVNVEIPVNNPALPSRITFDDVVLQIDERRLMLAPLVKSDSVLQRVQDVARKILADLPHTPVSAAGVNFMFSVQEPESWQVGLFKLPDTNALADLGATVTDTSLRRGLDYKDTHINLRLELSRQFSLLIELNFHVDTNDAESASRHVADSSKYRSIADDLIKGMYDRQTSPWG